jgi:hypothetical protein
VESEEFLDNRDSEVHDMSWLCGWLASRYEGSCLNMVEGSREPSSTIVLHLVTSPTRDYGRPRWISSATES